MLNSAVLDVAVGLAFIFLLVSLLVTATSEAAAGWLKWRSTHLWEGLEQLLQSPTARNQIYNHPLVKGLARVGVGTPDWGKKGENGPSYIPSRTFALVVIDILRRPHEAANALEDGLRQAATKATADPAVFFASVGAALERIEAGNPPTHVRQAVTELRTKVLPALEAPAVAALKGDVQKLIGRLAPADRGLAGPLEEWLNNRADAAKDYFELRSGLLAAIGAVPLAVGASVAQQLQKDARDVVNAFPHGSPEAALREVRAFLSDAPRRWLAAAQGQLPDTVAALSPMLHEAAGDVDRFRENLEIWFNDGMERVSGWYKRHVGVRQAVIAFVLAFALNIDALQITQTLWREPTLRQSLTASADDFARRGDVGAPTPQNGGRPSPSIEKGAVAPPKPPTPAISPPPPVDPKAEKAGPTAPTGDRTTESAATPEPGIAVSATLQAGRLFSGGASRVTVSWPTPASPATSITARTADDLLLLGVTASDTTGRSITFSPGDLTTSAEFYVSAGELTVERHARVEVTVSDEKQPAMAGTTNVDIDISPADSFALLQKRIRGLGLPIGWECPPDAAAGGVESGITIGGPVWCSTPTGRSGRRWTSLSWLGIDWYGWGANDNGVRGRVLAQRAYMLLLMVFGWSLTAAAASLGAPFWFDTLKRVTSIRAGGKPPEEQAPGRKVSQPREPGQRPREADLVDALKR